MIESLIGRSGLLLIVLATLGCQGAGDSTNAIAPGVMGPDCAACCGDDCASCCNGDCANCPKGICQQTITG